MGDFLMGISNILQFIGVLITILAAAAMGFIEHNNQKPNKKSFTIIVFFGGFLALLGQWYSTKDNDNKTTTIIEQGKQIDSLSLANLFLSQGNSTKLDQSLSQLDSIIDNSMITLGNLEGQSDKLSNVYKKAKQIQDYNTGGNSFAVVEKIFLPSNAGYISFFVSNHGDYPLYNLNIGIDEKERHFLKRPRHIRSFDDILKPSPNTYNIPMLKPDDGWVRLGDIKLPTRDSINFGASCKAKNGGVYQTIIAMRNRASQDWTFATQVKRGKQIVYEKIDPGFPHSQKNIKWDIDFGIPEGFPIPDSILDKYYPIKN